MKKSFILYCDSLSILKDLNNQQAGMLFKAIAAYHNNEAQVLPQELSLVFILFKNQFDRDENKWQEIKNKRVIAGAKGGKQKVANATKSKQKTPVSVNGNVTVTVNDKIDFSVFWKLYPRKEEKKTAATKWDKLPKETQEKILKTLPTFLKGKDVKFVPMPVTYLNNERWDDELTIEPTMSEEERKAEITRNFLARL